MARGSWKAAAWWFEHRIVEYAPRLDLHVDEEQSPEPDFSPSEQAEKLEALAAELRRRTAES